MIYECTPSRWNFIPAFFIASALFFCENPLQNPAKYVILKYLWKLSRSVLDLLYNIPHIEQERRPTMHWSEEIAQRVIARNPDKEEYVCAAGISPSGSVHIGNFRDIATSLFV